MTTIGLEIAADINRHHELACQCASQALVHAKEAGNLLLQAKASMKHGEWLPWLSKHVNVSARQAQRYMLAAQGRERNPITLGVGPTPAKSDSVSHLKPATLLQLQQDSRGLTADEKGAPRLFPGAPLVGEFVPVDGQVYAEPPRDLRRLKSLRGLSHEEVEQVFS
jgi:hypothetical protein